MHIRSLIYVLCLPIIPFGLAGCNQLELRKGPAPILDAASVQTAATNQSTIIYALAQDAGYAHPEMSSIDYYQVAQAGFNYVDDQCTAYFDTIFFLDRERSQLKSGLVAASATTAAILGVTSASTLSLSVVASAFGFASAATDILAGTYLYSLPPATTLGLVNKLQIAYRDAADRARADINTPTAAYHQIQSYLALCLPPTIETQVANQVSAATAVGVPVAGGSIAVHTGSSLPLQPAILERELKSKQISSVKSAANTSKPAPEVQQTARDKFIRATKMALCVPEADASLSPATQLAIKDYLTGLARPVPAAQIEPTDPAFEPDLSKAISQVKDCKALGFETAFEVGAFGVIENSSDPAKDRSDNIRDIQSKINGRLKANKSSTVITQTGIFDTQTRDAIRELRDLRKLSPGRMIDLPLDKYLNSPNKDTNQ